jgi:predicted RNase H-like HicB family nuclease
LQRLLAQVISCSFLREVPGVFSQGETLKELEENIEDAYKLLIEEELQTNHPISRVKEVLVDVA